MKIAIVLGTRPEIIKLSPVIRHCQNNQLDYFVVNTNQHYSDTMSSIFFKELQLPNPKYNLRIGSDNPEEQTRKMFIEIEKVLLKEKPDIVLVQGDTYTVLIVSVIASKLKIKIGHLEAGLRSHDKTMPEEINRIVTDHISNFLFCPTNKQKDILLGEGINRDKIFVTGNTIVDAVADVKNFKNNSLLAKYNLSEKEYILLTMHRPANVDNKTILEKQLKNISVLAKDKNLSVVFPIHPRTLKNIELFSIDIPENIKIIEPLGFIELLTLEKQARIILTDSGGIQEEACILGVPSLNLRENTERPECIEVGASKVVGSDYAKLLEGFTYYEKHSSLAWQNPFGDGLSAEKILEICQKKI